jgi:hypothetical protein
MIDIELSAVPNQSLSIVLDGALYEITVKAAGGIMSATIVRDNVTLVDNVRIVAGTPILPYRYQEAGNFVLLTEDEEYPDYLLFGSSQSLVYASALELAAARNE